jgi:hypothetical protein
VMRWNRTLARVDEIEGRIAAHHAALSKQSPLLPTDIAAPATHLPWSGQHPRDMRGSRTASCTLSFRRWSPIPTMTPQRSSC